MPQYLQHSCILTKHSGYQPDSQQEAEEEGRRGGRRGQGLQGQDAGWCDAILKTRCAQHRTDRIPTEKKAREEMAKKAGGKGPLNTGSQGIKKSGKK